MQLVLGAALIAASLVILLLGVVLPPRIRRPLASDDPADARAASPLARLERAAEGMTPVGLRAAIARDLDLGAGTLTPGRVVLLTVVGGVVLALVIGVLVTPFLGFLALVVAPLVARVLLRSRADALRRRFEDQLVDTLQLMASSLRAGNSLLKALDTVAEEAAQPSARQFVRAVNEIRVGADVGLALDAVAERMRSADFAWVSQAVAIHREVGGNLAEVLDQVGDTLRDRNQMRRQIRSLSADGRLSALVLVALPPAVTGILALVNPQFLAPMFSTPIGWVLIVISLLLFIAGGLWIRKLVTLEV
ncbi:type II secretion system F family protein [Salinibacterium sp. SYSU T00001]|uniref:type II secretion system F family protein n=1 Tax=Homoserinimonas sedimenticola TaxID=2986805 RepID=UPI002235E1F4|nr:type II secretion system F family protein [Salinibacterium sedimenticola]MCW4385427.1 type II secretion system F family protein [Salinibacterium sedimenticola]